MQDTASHEQAFAILKRAVDARLAHSERREAPVREQETLRLLARGGNAARVRDVARELGTAERSLHRDLVRWSGLSPKILAIRAATARSPISWLDWDFAGAQPG